jgi:hypothetical protein
MIMLRFQHSLSSLIWFFLSGGINKQRNDGENE